MVIRRLLWSVLLGCASFGAAGCGSDDATSSAAPTDAGATDTGAPDLGVPSVVDHGTVQDYGSGKRLPGITVTVGGVYTATTDAKGEYRLTLPKDKPMSLVLTGPGYVKTILAELGLSADLDRTIPLPPLSLFHLGQSALDGYDTTKGIVYLLVRTTGTCATADGGQIAVVSPAGAKLAYFDGKLPDAALTAITKSGDPDQPVAAVYNVPAGSAVDVTVTHPTCKHAAFPVTVSGITYNGKVAVEAGDVNSVLYHYLQ